MPLFVTLHEVVACKRCTFGMLAQSRLVEFKILVNWGMGTSAMTQTIANGLQII